MNPRDISVIIPTLNEEARVADAIASAIDAGAAEVIISDGGSTDATSLRAQAAGASKIVSSLPGRGIQLNSGAVLATREIVLFLHADNRLGSECLRQVCDHPDATWGAFHQRIDSSRRIYRAIEFGNAARVRCRSMAFGDQAIFVRREFFCKQGGFAEVPLMEDVDLSRRLRKIDKPLLLPGPIVISARRWEQQGVLRQTLRNWSLQLSFAIGVSPEKLRRRYP